MKTADRVLFLLAIGQVGLSVAFGLAAILLPEFRANGSAIVGIILGAFGTTISVMVGTRLAARGQEESQKETDKGGGR